MRTARYLIIFLLCVMLSAWTTPDVAVTDLEWNKSQRLSWEDFQGAANRNSFADAGTMVRISAKPYYKKRKLNYDVRAYFVRHQSWCKSKSTALLEHEQLHFDLAELYARKIRKKVFEYRQRGLKNVSEYHYAITRILQESNRVDENYDAATVHGASREKQALWSKNIKHQLELLDAYSTPHWEN